MKTILLVIMLFCSFSFSSKTTSKTEVYKPIFDDLDIFRIRHTHDKVTSQAKLVTIIEKQYKIIDIYNLY